MRYLSVIPARGGSKSIPKKNIYPVDGKPLIKYTIEAILNAKIEGDIVVSSDSMEILNVAREYPEIYRIKRPEDLSTDTASTEDALLHAIGFMKDVYQKSYDAVITLQPTSPLRTADTIVEFIEVFESVYDLYDAQLTLTVNTADYWIKRNGKFFRLDEDAPRRRQLREPLYEENGAIYVTRISSLENTHSVLGNCTNGFLISEEEGLDINEKFDLKLAEFLLKDK